MHLCRKDYYNVVNFYSVAGERKDGGHHDHGD